MSRGTREPIPKKSPLPAHGLVAARPLGDGERVLFATPFVHLCCLRMGSEPWPGSHRLSSLAPLGTSLGGLPTQHLQAPTFSPTTPYLLTSYPLSFTPFPLLKDDGSVKAPLAHHVAHSLGSPFRDEHMLIWTSGTYLSATRSLSISTKAAATRMAAGLESPPRRESLLARPIVRLTPRCLVCSSSSSSSSSSSISHNKSRGRRNLSTKQPLCSSLSCHRIRPTRASPREHLHATSIFSPTPRHTSPRPARSTTCNRP